MIVIYLMRCLLIAASLGVWHWSQRLLSRRNSPACEDNAIGLSDGIHRLTESINQRLASRRRGADALLISSSLVIDLLGAYLMLSAIFGRTILPFLGLAMIFTLRQIFQALCPLPPPKGMIWRDPGFPTFLVTYGTSNDLFFSGHTAIAIFGASIIASALGPIGIVLGVAIAAFEIGVVLVLRAHYTMDVFAGAVTALYVHRLAIEWAPTADYWISHVAAMIGK